jgi:diguanylate cyclase (GGDEF)-like protein/PAS domain S-box-containing protein
MKAPDHREPEARFRAMVSYSADIIAVVDAEGRLIEASPAAVEVLALDPGEMIGRCMLDLVHPDDRAPVADALRDAVEGNPDREPIVLRMQSGTGEWRDLEVTGRPVDGDADGEVVVVARDITERKRQEDLLRASERRYRALAGRASQLLVVLDATGRCTFVDDSPKPLLGWGADALGRDTRDLLVPEDRATFDTYFAQIVARRGLHPPTVCRIVDRFGGEHYLEVVANNLLDDPLVKGIVLDARDVTERHVAEQSLRHHAIHDALTGLANRTLFLDRVGQAVARVRRHPTSLVAVLLVDIDRIKMVNDSLGHSAGDEILVAVGQLLDEATGSADTVARLAGAQFGVCCENLRNESDALAMAKRLAERAQTPVSVAGHEVHLTATIGVALSRGNGDTPESLVGDADVALIRAKEKDRGRVELFDEESGLRAVHRLEVENGLRAALQNDELRLHYQPVVRLVDGDVAAAEALVRWQHPTRGLLSPDEFIPIAEETGLIKSIGEWVIEQACKDARDWRRFTGRSDLTVAVNVSARQLNDDDITQTVRAALAANDLTADALTVEVTETALMGDEDQARATLEQLHELGVRIAIDDFGTGYSSLSNLRKFRFDALKIDRSFVSGLAGDESEDVAIIAAVVALAHSLGITVIGEGVGTIDQARKLASLGCDRGQGYLWGGPAPLEHLWAS